MKLFGKVCSDHSSLEAFANVAQSMFNHGERGFHKVVMETIGISITGQKSSGTFQLAPPPSSCTLGLGTEAFQ